MSRPLTAAGWGPARPMIVSDPGKLTYFARANAVRAGIRGGAYSAIPGSSAVAGLSGLGYTVTDHGGTGIQEGTGIVDRRLMPFSVAGSTNPSPGYVFDPMVGYGDATAGTANSAPNTLNSNGTMLVDRFFNMFNSVLGRNQNSAPPLVQADTGPDWGMLLGVGALAIGGVWVAKKVFKK